METTKEAQAKKLKINSTNVKSFLFTSNKKLNKLETEKKRLIDLGEKEEKFKQKEKRIESPNKGKGPLGNIASFVLAGPMSIFDKIKEFLGIMFLGMLVNNLPIIIQKIKDFFNNPFIQGTLKVFQEMGKGLWEIIKTTITFAATTQKTITQNITKIKKDTDDLLKTFGFLEDDINKDIANLKSNQGQNKPPSPSGAPPAPKTGISQRSSANPTPQTKTQSVPVPVPQAHAEGGTVKKPKIKLQSFASGGTVKPKPAPTSNSKSTSFSKQETGKAKKSRKDISYFSNFNQTVKELSENATNSIKNNTIYEEMVNNFKKLTDMMGGDKKDKKTTTTPSTNPGGQSPPGIDLSIDVDPKDHIGYVGETGASKGPHIHIEDYATAGAPIPDSVKSSILVAGKPMTSGTRTSEIGWRWGKMHQGEDWDQNWNGKPISLTGGLKYVDFKPMGSDPRFDGYGNVTVIQAPNGKKYFLGHLSKGPKNIKELRKRQLEKQTQNVSQNIADYNITKKTQTGQASFYGGPTDTEWEGRRTAGGDIFNSNLMTAASNTFAMGTIVKVTNVKNKKYVIVKVNDTGGFGKLGRVLDLSYGAMKVLGGVGSGVIDVEIEVLNKKQVQKAGPAVPARLQKVSANFEGIGSNKSQNAFLPLNSGETAMVAFLMTQQVIQPYGIPVPMPQKSPAPVSSGPPALASGWENLG